MGTVHSLEKKSARELVEHLFRRDYGQMVARLARAFGSEHLDLAENVMQEAMIKALQVWPFEGIPDNPSGWLFQVAKNLSLDHIRRVKLFSEKEPQIADLVLENVDYTAQGIEMDFNPLFADDQLKLAFTCCHPILSKEAQIALTLKTLCGFSVREIARAFLSKDEAIEQRIVRAKAKIRDERIPYEIPTLTEMPKRLDSVLDVLYLLFNEGYSATIGDDLIRTELCDEAIRLNVQIAGFKSTNTPKARALLALFYFQSSRLHARLDRSGDLLLLEEQDRSLWDQERIQYGMKYLHLSAEGDELTDFHLQASIAACHATAPDFEQTNWKQILADYDELILRNHSPVVALNRAVAILMLNGPKAAITELEKLASLPPLKNYYLFPATLAECYRRLGDSSQARVQYEKATQLAGTEPERRFLLKRMNLIR